MGQRLNIEITNNGEALANAYYHWSAYTSSSLELANQIISNLDKIEHQNDTILAIRLLETTGALLTEDEIKEINQIDSTEVFKNAANRSNGLIAFTEKGMDKTRTWEEGRVEIDLGEEEVIFNVINHYDKESYIEFYEKTEEEYEKLPVKDFFADRLQFSFEEFKRFSSEVLELIKNGTQSIRLNNGDVITFTE